VKTTLTHMFEIVTGLMYMKDSAFICLASQHCPSFFELVHMCRHC